MPIAVADPVRLSGVATSLAPDGTVYVVWVSSNPEGTAHQLRFTKSADGGRTWCVLEPPLCESSDLGPSIEGPVQFGNLAVAADGTVAVMFYDHRSDPPGTSPPARTDLWLRSSRDGGLTWSEQHLAGPFDRTTALRDGYIGDYHGLVPLGPGFGATFVLAKPLAVAGPTDVFFASVPTP